MSVRKFCKRVNTLKVYTILSLIAFCIAAIPNKTEASHAMGADLAYTCLGNGQYALTLSFYRDCTGISAPTSATINMTSSCNTLIATLPLISWVEISPICPTALSSCQGGTEPGAEQYIYSDTISVSPCADWVFSFSHCCRNPLITNLQTPSGQNIFIKATLDNTGPDCNSSPIFTTLPVPYVCMGQLYNDNYGAIDADGDSLVYSLINPMTTGMVNIQYVTGFSPTNPMSSSHNFSINIQ